MSEELSFQRGSHEIHATLYGKYSQGVLLCPPHPKFGGSREDSRLVTSARELASSGIAALCMDYSAYTGGPGEVADVIFVLEHWRETMETVGLLGYSYGAVIASLAAAQMQNLGGLVLISPLKQIDHLKIDMSSPCKKLIIYGLEDDFVVGDINELYESARGEKQRLILSTDHFFAGYEKTVADAVQQFFQKVFSTRSGQSRYQKNPPTL